MHSKIVNRSLRLHATVTTATAGLLHGPGTTRRRHRTDTGASLVEYVILTAVVVTATLLIAGIIIGKITDRANGISL